MFSGDSAAVMHAATCARCTDEPLMESPCPSRTPGPGLPWSRPPGRTTTRSMDVDAEQTFLSSSSVAACVPRTMPPIALRIKAMGEYGLVMWVVEV